MTQTSARCLAGVLLLTSVLACSDEQPTEPSVLTCDITWQMTIVSAETQGPIAAARIWITEVAGQEIVERTLAHTDAAGKALITRELALPSNVPQPIQPFISVNVSADGHHTANPQETVGRCENTSLTGTYALQPCLPGEICA